MADVSGGRSAPMNEAQKLEADKTIIGEFSDVKHVRGILSMGRYFPFKKIFYKHLTFLGISMLLERCCNLAWARLLLQF